MDITKYKEKLKSIVKDLKEMKKEVDRELTNLEYKDSLTEEQQKSYDYLTDLSDTLFYQDIEDLEKLSI